MEPVRASALMTVKFRDASQLVWAWRKELNRGATSENCASSKDDTTKEVAAKTELCYDSAVSRLLNSPEGKYTVDFCSIC